MANDFPAWEGENFKESSKLLMEKMKALGDSGNSFNRGMEVGIANAIAVLFMALQSDYFERKMSKEDYE